MKIIRLFIYLAFIFVLSVGLPRMMRFFTDQPHGNTFIYYSSVDHAFCSINYDEAKDKVIRKNIVTGKEYSQSQFDSILPLFFYRQLYTEGRMPDSLNSTPITRNLINQKSFQYKYSPEDKNRPSIQLYPLFESVSGRVDLKMPEDLFRIDSKMEFIIPANNKLNKAKSEKYTNILNTLGFKFPAKSISGNPSARKMYDEGYFVTDSNNQIFHIKMVNSKPFIKKLNLPKTIIPAHIATYEPNDRSFYGFLYAKSGEIFKLSTSNYALEKLDIGDFNLEENQFLVYANPLYWIIHKNTQEGKFSYALDLKTNKIIDTNNDVYKVEEKSIMDYVLPFRVAFTKWNTKYFAPQFIFNGLSVFIFNLIFLSLFVVINVFRSKPNSYIELSLVAATGIYGFITCLLFKNKI
ncbi:MAG: DUF4857 domain-containing protein [Marinifilaceae bacterium]|jgi:hypothetical protein|nr:DUF4857 domain-containing protein [Marinifilaceae bacterium]